MTPDPLERLAAEALVGLEPVQGFRWETQDVEHLRLSVLQALRAARRLGAEEMREACVRAVDKYAGDLARFGQHDRANVAACAALEIRHSTPDPEPTESER